MGSALQRHYDRVLAEKRASGSGVPPAAARASSSLAGLLATHRAELKACKSRERKIAAKLRFLPEYESHIAAALSADAGGTDDVLMTALVWRIDTGDYDGALEIAAYALRHGVPLPSQFARDLPDLLIEEIAERALTVIETGAAGSGRPEIAGALERALGRALEMTAEADIHDAVAAKAHKALGRLQADAEPVRAVDHLEAALRLDPKGAGVKTELARLHKRVADVADADKDEDEGAPGAG